MRPYEKGKSKHTMGLYQHRDDEEPLPKGDTEKKRHPKKPKERTGERWALSAWERLRRAALANRHIEGMHGRPGFIALLAYLLAHPSPPIVLLGIKLTADGELIGRPQIVGEDIAMIEFRPYVGLSSLQRAVEGICKYADERGLSNAERASLLNRLPRWKEVQ